MGGRVVSGGQGWRQRNLEAAQQPGQNDGGQRPEHRGEQPPGDWTLSASNRTAYQQRPIISVMRSCSSAPLRPPLAQTGLTQTGLAPSGPALSQAQAPARPPPHVRRNRFVATAPTPLRSPPAPRPRAPPATAATAAAASTADPPSLQRRNRLRWKRCVGRRGIGKRGLGNPGVGCPGAGPLRWQGTGLNGFGSTIHGSGVGQQEAMSYGVLVAVMAISRPRMWRNW